MKRKTKKLLCCFIIFILICFAFQVLQQVKDWTDCLLETIVAQGLAHIPSDIAAPKIILAKGLPLFAESSEVKPTIVEEKSQPVLSKRVIKNADAPLVAIYHTHAAECYLPWYGATHTSSGKPGNIVDVGNILTKRLEEQGIGTVHAVRVHDYPTFRESYRRSYVTASELVEKYPSLKIIIDLHRDGGVKEDPVTEIEGKKTARVLLDVGTDRLGLAHPNWQKNLALNERIKKRMDEKYPGLCRGILIAEARYNQHVSPGAILLEIGDEKCTKEEASNAVAFCAKVLAEIVREMS